MVRVGDWKLVYYHGYHDPQLFNLADDPDELDDRANDPRCRSVREALMRRALEHWDPDLIASRMRVLKREQDLMVQWARNTDPPDHATLGPSPGDGLRFAGVSHAGNIGAD